MHALIFGATPAAREMATLLYDDYWYVTTSLTAIQAHTQLPVGNIRIDQCNDPAALAQWLITEHIDIIVDTTDPFTEHLSVTIAEAARATGIPVIALQQPVWTPQTHDRWLFVHTLDEAAASASREYHHIFLHLQPNQLPKFCRDPHNLYVLRKTEAPLGALPARHRIVPKHQQVDLETEKKFLRDNQIDCIVMRNDGQPEDDVLLMAARSLGIAVIMLQRPETGATHHLTTSPQEAFTLIQTWF
ncbi:precorrin-6A/cobalt-precorrin-6A reductase [Corynebacterium sp. HS2168-gen11]|uniref:precorrin-6A/cobalt-precorrin-6A reductase n=1 Tax=Corynebacterium sp. HS2168-gen11 TaxID=2974027 RepID=UPI00216AC97D|nr:precorrin-6A/cobalt-precorrin-6A reductase [Corynebacterium sp. HS2168-gen11]MCS4535070.1 precorrin-6A/cobalt-precorrin-6A reductase [Corynebacterium sp. HS2168-gen11]